MRSRIMSPSGRGSFLDNSLCIFLLRKRFQMVNHNEVLAYQVLQILPVILTDVTRPHDMQDGSTSLCRCLIQFCNSPPRCEEITDCLNVLGLGNQVGLLILIHNALNFDIKKAALRVVRFSKQNLGCLRMSLTERPHDATVYFTNNLMAQKTLLDGSDFMPL